MIGIEGYGVYVPYWRITTDELASAYGTNAQRIKKGLGVEEKTVAGRDEDCVTMAVQASRNALIKGGLKAQALEAIYVGSESHPYAVKPSSTIVGQALGCSDKYFAADFEFACKAGTSGFQAIFGMVKSNSIKLGLAIGTDVAQARPGDILQYSAGAGSAAFIIGSDEDKVLATIDGTISKAENMPDFWRREGQAYPQHGGRFTGEPAYIRLVADTTKQMLETLGLSYTDIDHVVFHQPNGKFPLLVAKQLGFSKQQWEYGLLAPMIGNCYSASSLIGLASVLDKAKPQQRILLTSYGSGGGCDSFVFTTTAVLEKARPFGCSVDDYVSKKSYVSYAQYCRRTENQD